MKVKDPNPAPNAYPYDKKDERNYLGDKERVYAFKYGDKTKNQDVKIIRFIDQIMKKK